MPEFYMIVARKYQKKIADYFFSGGGATASAPCLLRLWQQFTVRSNNRRRTCVSCLLERNCGRQCVTEKVRLPWEIYSTTHATRL